MNALQAIQHLYTAREIRVPVNANKERVQMSIDILQRVADQDRKFDLRSWYDASLWYSGSPDVPLPPRPTTEQELHACGTSACAMGWIAMSPEWREAGGESDPTENVLFFGKKDGMHAAMLWLGAPLDSLIRALFINVFLHMAVPVESIFGTQLSDDVIAEIKNTYVQSAESSPFMWGNTVYVRVTGYDKPSVAVQDVIAQLVSLRDTGHITLYVDDNPTGINNFGLIHAVLTEAK